MDLRIANLAMRTEHARCRGFDRRGFMRSLLRLMQPDNFEDISAAARALPAGPDGRQLPHQLRAAQERPAGDHADPSRARGAAQGDPRHDPRPDRLPGAGHGHRAEGRRLLPRQGRPAAPRDGQEEEVGAGQAVRVLRAGHEGQRLLRRRDQGPVGHPAAVLRLRLQQGAHRRLRPGLLLDRLPQGQLPGRVHGRAAHLGQGRQGQVARSTSTSAAAWASRCSRRTSTSPTPTSPRAAPTSASACRRSATSAATWSTASSPRARRRAASPTSRTSCARCPPSSATSGSSSR